MTSSGQQSRATRIPAFAGLAALVSVTILTLVIAQRPDALTRTTIRLSLFEYAAALSLMLRATAADWQAQTRLGQSIRWLWTWACLTFLIHVACAFHFTHHWSHAHAFEQTRRESGFGEGLYVNELFMLLWSADVIAWWIAPGSYARRAKWIDVSLHAFMLFIAFNATVVFESGAVRWAGLVATIWLLAAFLRRPDASSVPRSSGNSSEETFD